jgi:ATP-dependent DNA ligase
VTITSEQADAIPVAPHHHVRAKSFIIDAEAVACDEAGLAIFQNLRGRMRITATIRTKTPTTANLGRNGNCRFENPYCERRDFVTRREQNR